MTTRLLGFSKPTANSIDSVSDRDFVVEFIFTLSLTSIHLSRLAEEIILWASQHFNFIKLPEELSMGSSIMPQKKNPDGAELVRGNTSNIISNLNSIFIILKGKSKMIRGKKSIKSGYKKAIITLKKGQSIDLATGI